VSPAPRPPFAALSRRLVRSGTPFGAVALILAFQLLAGTGPVLAFPLYLAVTLVSAMQLGRGVSIGSSLFASVAILIEPLGHGRLGSEVGSAVLLAASLPLVSIAVGEVTRQARLRAAEAQRSAAAVAASERRLSSIVEATNIGLAVTDMSGTLTLANERFAAIVGRRGNELVGLTLVGVTAPADRPPLESALARLKLHEIEKWDAEMVQERPDGTPVPVSIAINLVGGPSGGESILLVEEAETSTRRRADALRDALVAVQQLLVGAPGWQPVMLQVLARLGGSLGWDEALYWAVDGEQEVLRAAQAWRAARIHSGGRPELMSLPPAARGEGLAGRVWQSGVVASERHPERAPEGGPGSAAAFPVIDRGAVMGVIELRSARDRDLDPDEAAVLTAAGVEIGRFIRRSETEQALRRSEADHRAIFERSPIGIARVSSEGELLEANAALLQMLEHDFETVRQGSWPSLLRAYDQAAGRVRRPPLLAGITETGSVQVRAATGDGRWLWLQLTATSIPDSSGRPEHLLVMVEDVTVVRETADKLAEALESQRSANANLEKLDRTKTEFLSITSHEFRTALTGIQGFSELIRDGGLEPDEIRSYGGYIFNDADRVNRLIGEMLDLDRMESGRMSMRTAEVDLNEVLTHGVSRAGASAASVGFETDLDRNLPVVLGDRDRLIQVVSNLVSNAVKYSPEGGKVTVMSRAEGGFAVVGVSDTGLGIPPDEIGHVFERFRRVRSGATQSIPGTGLGLAIVKQIVEMHGGKIWVESAVGHGSSFHFTIPLAPADAGGQPPLHG